MIAFLNQPALEGPENISINIVVKAHLGRGMDKHTCNITLFLTARMPGLEQWVCPTARDENERMGMVAQRLRMCANLAHKGLWKTDPVLVKEASNYVGQCLKAFLIKHLSFDAAEMMPAFEQQALDGLAREVGRTEGWTFHRLILLGVLSDMQADVPMGMEPFAPPPEVNKYLH